MNVACSKADLLFILDSSGSINRDIPTNSPITNWGKINNWIRATVADVPVGPNAYQISVINFGDKAKLNFTFNQYPTNALVDRAIAEVPWKDQQTNTSGALWRAIDWAYNITSGDRRDAPNIVMLISDGQGNVDEDLTEGYANTLKTMAEVFVIGATDLIRIEELEIISSSPSDNYLTVIDSFDDFNDNLNPMEAAQCNGFRESS